MKSQVIKKDISKELFYNFLDTICIKESNFYILNNESYKKGVFNNLIIEFMNKLIPYYYESKQYYLIRHHNYNTFLTVIRQLCNVLDITYNKEVQYVRSVYKVYYKILII